jgi:hypothetical protein
MFNMMNDEPAAVAQRARSELDKIEREAMRDLPGWMQYLDSLSNVGREIAMSAALADRATFDRWRVLRMVVAEM